MKVNSTLYALRSTLAFFLLCLGTATLLPAQTTWTSQTSGTTNALYGVWGSDANNIWAVGNTGTILKSTNGGSSWTSQTSGTTNALRGVWGSDANNICAVGDGGTILKSTNGGSSWTSQTSGTTNALRGVWGSDANNICAVGDGGTILKSTNGGSSWTSQTSGTTNALFGVWGSDANNIWAVGLGGTIRKSTNGGSSWTSETPPQTITLYGVWGSAANNIWAACSGGTVFNYNGSSWTSQTLPTTNAIRGVWGSDANNIWVVGSAGTIFKYDGSTWAAEAANASVTNNAIYGVGTKGIIVGLTGTILTKTLSVAMPVELLSFSGKNTDNTNVLTWQTANEVNNKGFEVERLNGNDWQNIGFVKGNNKASTYQFLDNLTLERFQTSPTLYYRLKQLDNDGKETVSKVIALSNPSKNRLKIYPSVTSSFLTIETDLAADFQILNLLGQQVLNHPTSGRFETSPTFINVSTLPQGTYVLKVGAEQVKFVKQ